MILGWQIYRYLQEKKLQIAACVRQTVVKKRLGADQSKDKSAHPERANVLQRKPTNG